jgi:hypothetical protein
MMHIATFKNINERISWEFKYTGGYASSLSIHSKFLIFTNAVSFIEITVFYSLEKEYADIDPAGG